MIDLGQLMDVKRVMPDTTGTIDLAENNSNVKMLIRLTGVGENTLVYRFDNDNPVTRNVLTKKFEVDEKNVFLGMVCDYLAMIPKHGKACPLFIELAKTSTGKRPRKKLEQLYGSAKIIDFCTSICSTDLNQKLPIDEARYLLIYQKSIEKEGRKSQSQASLVANSPRVVMKGKNTDNNFELFYYGGSNKIIKVAKKIMGTENELGLDDVFNALPTASPTSTMSAFMKRKYADLVSDYSTVQSSS